MLQEDFTKSVRESLSKIRQDYFSDTKLVQLKIEGDSWRAQLAKLFSKSIAASISQQCKLKQGDVVLLAIGHRLDAVSTTKSLYKN